eukprot:c6446_g1_i2.p1 GENE.c6446_g1_i2~~c6446_g1_i2.p1  ORF type:complete len:103 (+),score=35.94 c6446_g1_i2:330-638(+)
MRRLQRYHNPTNNSEYNFEMIFKEMRGLDFLSIGYTATLKAFEKLISKGLIIFNDSNTILSSKHSTRLRPVLLSIPETSLNFETKKRNLPASVSKWAEHSKK